MRLIKIAKIIIVKITNENIAKVKPVLNLAAIGYAIAILTTGFKFFQGSIIFDTNQTIISALCMIIHTEAATSETPESINISGPPSSSPVRLSKASNGKLKNINRIIPIKVIDILFCNSSLKPLSLNIALTENPIDKVVIIIPKVTIAALSYANPAIPFSGSNPKIINNTPTGKRGHPDMNQGWKNLKIFQKIIIIHGRIKNKLIN